MMQINETNSYTEYTTTEPTTDFVVGFEYFNNKSIDTVNVTVDSTDAVTAGYVVTKVNNAVFRLTPAVPSGSTVRLIRETDLDAPIYKFSEGALFRAPNVDANFKQILHAQQEVRDGFTKLSNDTYQIIDTLEQVAQDAQEAADAANNAAIDASNAAQAVGNKVDRREGAALPYNPDTPYIDGASVIRDGKLQQKQGAVWVDIGGGKEASDILDSIANVNQQLINNSRLTVDNFGAKGDGVTDDSVAFQAYIDSALTSMTVFLGQRKAVYMIKKQIDFKGKGLVGHGFSRQDTAQYNHTSLYVDGKGDFTNSDTNLNNCALINVGNEIRNLQFVGNGDTDAINGMHLRSAYNVTIANVNIRGFYNQVYATGITVAFRVSDFTSISCKNAGFYFADTASAQSTTAYFVRCSWQWGKCPILFAKEVFGCSFRDIILEYMETGFTAKVWSNCVFDSIWAEETLNNAPADWLVNTMHQQSFNNQYSNLYIRNPWLNRADPTAVAVADSAGGVMIENTAIGIADASGYKTLYSPLGIRTRHANYAGASNSPTSNRKLSITSQAVAEGSGFITPVVIEAPNGALWFKNQDNTDYRPVTVRYLIGANAANNAAYYGIETYTRKNKSWSTQEIGSGSVGTFYAPMMLTYWGQETTQQINNGWTIRKETAAGQFVVERVSGNTDYLSKPQILVSGVVNGAGVGNLTPTVHAIQMIENYTGSWLAYGQCAGFRIAFKDLTGAAVDVQRFTVAFTSAR